MPIRNTHDQARIETPRADELPQLDPDLAKAPLDGRSKKGTFGTGNQAAKSRGAKRVLKQPLGGLDADPQMKHDAEVMFMAIMRDMPADDAEVRALVAAQCRNAVFATRYANQATIAGITSKDGMKWAELSRSHDLAAQRMAVSALEIAIRMAPLHAERARAASFGRILEIAPIPEYEPTALPPPQRPNANSPGLAGREFWNASLPDQTTKERNT